MTYRSAQALRTALETGYWHGPPRPESAWTGYADG
jgi:hypothetical protein